MDPSSSLVPVPYIVALTAYNTNEFKEKCLSQGMNEFLTKPIDVEKLTVILNDLKLKQV